MFRDIPPSIVAVFCERVPMVKGRWDPDASTATAYAWFIWFCDRAAVKQTRMLWITPGQREALTRPDDRRRFACAPSDMLPGFE